MLLLLLLLPLLLPGCYCHTFCTTGAAPAALALGPVLGLGPDGTGPHDGPAAATDIRGPLQATAAAGGSQGAGRETAGVIVAPVIGPGAEHQQLCLRFMSRKGNSPVL